MGGEEGGGGRNRGEVESTAGGDMEAVGVKGRKLAGEG